MLFTIPDDGEKVLKNKNCKRFKSSVLTSFCLKNKAKVLNSYVIKCPRLGTTERYDDTGRHQFLSRNQIETLPSQYAFMARFWNQITGKWRQSANNNSLKS